MDAEPSNAKPAERRSATDAASSEEAGVEGFCANCRLPLIPGGAPGECLRCLVNFASVQPEETFEEEYDPKVDGGLVRRYGHFEIARGLDGEALELGRGAMGTTYRAMDTVLQRVVALKVIERRVAEHPAARTRFLREARAAAQFQHPNVATVSHYGEQADECFYAMELVEGETLEARVQREGPLSTALTLEIATQVARALAAAEARGVVHRDLKPTNLMLATHDDAGGNHLGGPIVKVIDFGLAKAVSVAGDIEGAFETRGGFVGTPAFASPEQFERSPDNEIDHRSDIYSLGVTMWYALCGQPPFAGQNLAGIRSQQSEPLPLKRLMARKVPRRCVVLLQSMLAIDPTQRPQSARELLDRLDDCRAGLPAEPQMHRRKRRHRWLLATTLFMAAAAVASVWWMRHHASEKGADRSIAILPFENLSPDPGDAFFATGIRDQITANLAHVAALKVIDAESVGKYPPGKRDFGRIGSELGVRHLLEASVRRADGQVHVAVRLIDSTASADHWDATFDRPLADCFVMQSEVTRAIADHLDTRLSPDEKAAIDAPPTNDPVAYDLYLRAREDVDFSVGAEQMIKKTDRSLRLLREATTRDPNFVLAYCAIARIYDTVYIELGNVSSDDPTLDRRAAAESALQTARRLQPDAGEVHLAVAEHLYDVVWDYPQARIELDLARRTLPNNAQLEQTAAYLVSPAKGIHMLERAAELDPRNPGRFEELECMYRYLRQYDGAERALAKLTALTPGDDAFPVRIECAVEAMEARADLAPLRAALAAAPPGKSPAGVSIFYLLLAYLDRDGDGLARAVAAAPEENYHLFGFDYPKAWFAGLGARLRGDEAGARTAFTAARIPVAASVAADPSYKNARMLSLLALIDAGLGRTDDAVREGLLSCEILPEKKASARAPILHCNLAVVYAWTGQPDKAIAQLEPWIEKPAGRDIVYKPTYGDLKLNPAWDPLRTDPRFLRLVEQLAPKSARTAAGP